MQNAQRLVNKLQKEFFFRQNLKTALTAFFYQYALRKCENQERNKFYIGDGFRF